MTKRKPKTKPATSTPLRDAYHNPLEFFQGSFGFGSWHWRLTHPNGNIVATGAEGYSSEAKARQGFMAAAKLSYDAWRELAAKIP